MAITGDQRNTGSELNRYGTQPAETQSFLGKTIQIKGEITCDEALTIEGEVKGNIKVNKILTIGKTGQVKGEIDAREVRIIGKVEGSIVASERLAISPEGNFSGNIKTDKLVIEEGAVFKGKVNLEDDHKK